jgi:hypothetical protein
MDVSAPDNGQRPFPFHIRIFLFVALLALWAVVLVAAVAFLLLVAVACFFWGWDGWQVLPYALLALGVSIGAAWLSSEVIRKVDRSR